MHHNWTVDKFVWSKDRLSNLSAFIHLQTQHGAMISLSRFPCLKLKDLESRFILLSFRLHSSTKNHQKCSDFSCNKSLIRDSQ